MFAAWFSKQCDRSLSVKPDVMRADDLSKIFASSEFEHKDKDLCLSSGGMHQLVLGMLDRKASGSNASESTRWFISVCLQESSCKTSWLQYGAQLLTEEQKALVLARCDPQIQGACERATWNAVLSSVRTSSCRVRSVRTVVCCTTLRLPSNRPSEGCRYLPHAIRLQVACRGRSRKQRQRQHADFLADIGDL